MASRRSRLTAAVAATAAAGLVMTSCAIGGDDSDSDLSGGSIEPIDALSGAELKVGSKDFDEQLLLGQITIVALEAAGAAPVDNTNIQGSANTRRALETGEIDLYWDYTGTGWITYLKHTDPIPDSQEQYDAVKKEDLEENKIVWMTPAPANNTYALAAKQETVDKYDVHSLSDYAALASDDPAAATICVESEFKGRNDGFPGVEETYGFDLPDEHEKLMDTAVVYTELDKGDACNFGEVFETDGRVAAMNFVLLEDDKQFFPIYNPALSVVESVADDYPELEELFQPIADKLTTATLAKLNKEVSVDGKKPVDVATQWLRDEGFIGEG